MKKGEDGYSEGHSTTTRIETPNNTAIGFQALHSEGHSTTTRIETCGMGTLTVDQANNSEGHSTTTRIET